MMYQANEARYDNMVYNRCGRSGILLPFISLGLWHNFGGEVSLEKSREMVLGAFDLGITHFDLANNYGPPAGSAEETFGTILKKDLMPYRDEIIVSSKAGYYMWPGPYGEWGSKKNLIASCDQSLKRMGLDYVDIFYHHRPDPDTPLEETMDALATLVRQGKALYVGISNYKAADAKRAFEILEGMGIHCLIHQPSYSMFNRWIEEDGLLDVLEEKGVGAICFSPLAQGLLTSRYFDGIPADSRAAGTSKFLSPDRVTADKVEKAKKLNEIAAARGQSLSQMALAWCLRHKQVTSLIIGASKLSQIEENVGAARNLTFTDDELAAIEAILQA
ncbi:MAG: aldo/keto reductase [Oscillospiraceae bacterium]|nr:aldo/keto reductase [Oscillospiraceae bacterium]